MTIILLMEGHRPVSAENIKNLKLAQEEFLGRDTRIGSCSYIIQEKNPCSIAHKHVSANVQNTFATHIHTLGDFLTRAQHTHMG